MFDLMELDQAEAGLRAIAGGEAPAPVPHGPVERPRGDISRCPFHNGAAPAPREAAQ